MVFEHIEKLKQQYTDKYVQIDSDRPELARFKGRVGQVKTVNMSGRALVEFLDYYLNIGRYDIEVDYLKVVEKPEPKAAEAKTKPAAKKPVGGKKPAGDEKKKLSPLEMARMQGAAGKAGEKEAAPSTAEKIEAARRPKGDGTTAKSAAAPSPAGGNADRSKMGIADVLAAARAEKSGGAAQPKAAATPAAAKPAQPDRSKMSVADILAAAKAEKSGAAPTAQQEPPADEPAGESPAAKTAVASEKVDRASMSVDDMLAWCRAHDAS